jgi:hypothetical protein
MRCWAGPRRFLTRPRPCPAGPRKASCPSWRPWAAIVATREAEIRDLAEDLREERPPKLLSPFVEEADHRFRRGQG